MTELTVSIASFNTADYLEECLASIYNNSKGLGIEVIVVDNASSDNSVRMVRDKFPQVKLIENKVNRGFSGAHNQAIAASSSKYFLVLNSDIKVLENAFQELVDFMNIHKEAAAATSMLLNSDGSLQENLGPFPSLWSELICRLPVFLYKCLKKKYNYEDTIEIDDFADPCAIIRREIIDKIGGYDEQFFLYIEETDWHYRMKLNGGKFYFVPDSRVIHYGGRSIPDDKNKKFLLYQQNLYKYFRKHHSAIQLLFLKIIVYLSGSFTLIKLGILNLFYKSKDREVKVKLVEQILRLK